MAGALIGALRVSLSAETSAFEAGMKRSQRTAKTTANSIVSDFKGAGGVMNQLKAGVAGFVSALSVGTILAAARASLDYAASLGETAAQLGVTTRELQNFRAAAAENGASLEEADAGLGKLTLNMSKAISGSKQAAAAFSSAGVSIADMTTKSRWEIIGQIADKMIEQGGAAKNAAAGTAIFGRGFQKLIPTLDQGSAGINDLAAANENLGGVLSDKEIQNADKTADKIDQLYRVLKTKLASDVAANSNAIGEFTTFLFGLVDAATKARQAINDFVANYNAFNIGTGKAFGFGYKGRSVTTKLGEGGTADAEARRRGLKLMSDVPPGGTGAPPKFLAGGGGGGGRKGGKDRSAEEALRKQLDALRDQNQFDQDILRAKADVLQAQQSLARNEDDRANIGYELLDLDRRQYEGQLAYEVQINALTKGAEGITQAQADQLLEHYTITESLKREAIQRDQAAANRERIARLADVDFDIQREKLDLEAGLAETASEQRDVQLRLLDLWYRQERAKLDAIMAEEEIGSVAWEEARRRKAALDANQQARRDNVNAGTRSPLEDYAASLPLDAARMNEALENVAVNGFQKLEDGLMGIIDGTKSVGEAFKEMADQIIADLIRIAIQKYIIGTIGSAFGLPGFGGGGEVGATGFASGGFVSGPGGPTADRIPAMLSNGEFVINAKSTKKFLPLLKGINDGEFARMATGGLALPRTSMGERIRMANDNESGRRGGVTFDLRGAVMTEDLLKQMNQIGAQAADQGGNLGVQRMRDLNERTFGRASR